MILKIWILFLLLAITYADKDDKKWVWDSNSRNGGRSAALRDPEYSQRQGASPRYEVYENDRPYNSYPTNNFNSGPFNGNQIPFDSEGPFRPGPASFPNERPGGVYGPNSGPGYGQGQGEYHSEDRVPGILTGPIPSWEKEGPFKEFDRCKCAAKFNCNSPGISYGHCDVGKQYCCYSTNKKDQLGGPPPSRPIHSAENGVLMGPGGPFDGPGRPFQVPGSNNLQRPPFDGPRPGGFEGSFRPGGSFRPEGSYRPGGSIRPGGGGFGLGGRPRPGFTGHYSNENGVLVGPGGPFDRPNFDSGFSPRSASTSTKPKS